MRQTEYLPTISATPSPAAIWLTATMPIADSLQQQYICSHISRYCMITYANMYLKKNTVPAKRTSE